MARRAHTLPYPPHDRTISLVWLALAISTAIAATILYLGPLRRLYRELRLRHFPGTEEEVRRIGLARFRDPSRCKPFPFLADTCIVPPTRPSSISGRTCSVQIVRRC